ncbi:HEPN domain-containing protein [Rhizobium sp. LjRoot258]|uniref:HEPN domain-containing protein n=1 Tax=Rhizobium sp. LjRoot258 TaxID=3342299 RepID=UPI003ECD95BA
MHQALEQVYSGLLLVFSNYSPPSHNLSLVRNLAEERCHALTDAWPRDQHRYVAWFNRLNEAYVKARYSRHYTNTRGARLAHGTGDICHRSDRRSVHPGYFPTVTLRSVMAGHRVRAVGQRHLEARPPAPQAIM